MILYINSKDRYQIEVALKDGDKVLNVQKEENEFGSQVLLSLITKSLRTFAPGVNDQINWNVLTGIEVEKGPGSFTGLRVGVSVANALGYALGIPVNGKKVETEIEY